ncbi:hypothetical protein V6N13_096344 [Hibiscus sabdariffa]
MPKTNLIATSNNLWPTIDSTGITERRGNSNIEGKALKTGPVFASLALILGFGAESHVGAIVDFRHW